MPTKEISTKSNKNEILEAYYNTLEQIKSLKKTAKQDEKREKTQQAVITQAAEQTPDRILHELSQVKSHILRSFESLEEQLLKEHKKLAALQQAIVWQTHELETLHGIQVEAETFTALVQTQQEKKSVFEKEMQTSRQTFEEAMQQKRAEWKKEQELVEASRKEQDMETKKQRQREEADYVYQRDTQRQKEQDQYAMQQASLEKALVDQREALEKEFAEREAAVRQSEQELKTLREQTAHFPAELETAVTQAVTAAQEQLQLKTHYERQLLEKERAGEKQLYEQRVLALEAKSAEQTKYIQQLTEKANAAGLQVQSIAMKAIEGAARQVIPYTEKVKEEK